MISDCTQIYHVQHWIDQLKDKFHGVSFLNSSTSNFYLKLCAPAFKIRIPRTHQSNHCYKSLYWKMQWFYCMNIDTAICATLKLSTWHPPSSRKRKSSFLCLRVVCICCSKCINYGTLQYQLFDKQDLV